jgi:hypothetical protein
MIVEIGMSFYLLIKSCDGFGEVDFPLDDNTRLRELHICTDYGPEQTREIEIHEVLHACLHNHEHHFKTRQELADDLKYIDKQDAELFTASLAHCISQALEKIDDSDVFRVVQTDNIGSGRRSNDSSAGKKAVKDKP